MTVEELLKKLRKAPRAAKVAWRDHDQSEAEINGWVTRVDVETSDCLELVYRRDACGEFVVVLS